MANINKMTQAEINLVKKSNDVYLIGRFGNDGYLNVTETGDIRFFINPISVEPTPIIKLEQFDDKNSYIGFDRYQDPRVLPPYYDFSSMDFEARKDELYDHFDNRIVIFRPQYTYSSKKEEWYKNAILNKIIKGEFAEDAFYVPIPTVDMENYQFENIIDREEYFELDNFSADVYDSPDFVVCGDYAYRLRDINNSDDLLVAYERNHKRWKFTSKDIVKVDLNVVEEFKNDVIYVEDLWFVENAYRNDILLTKEYLEYDKEEEKKKTEPQEQTNAEETQDAAQQDIPVDAPVALTEEETGNNDEKLFIQAFSKLTGNNGLAYDEEDLINFHTSVKTNALTILAGMSGTGKTQLAYNYAKMLNLSEENNNLLFLPISPSYTEPSDVLGYLNAMNGKYVPSETGLVQFLKHASDNPEQMHMVIFDEMNLSQVEYWFSPFISILEKDDDERYLKLYDKGAGCTNSENYPESIQIGNNIVFVGTVNIDDTTKDFSDRLLDRTFVVNLKRLSFAQLGDRLEELKNNQVDINKVKCRSVREFREWTKNQTESYIGGFEGHKDELEFLDAVNQLLSAYIPGCGISYRVLRNISNYLSNIPKDENKQMMISRQRAFDIIINQTVMTKIRGTETQLGIVLGNYDPTKNHISDSKLLQLLDKYNNVSEFALVRKAVEKKLKELYINGYAN